jgi:amino acid transporter
VTDQGSVQHRFAASGAEGITMSFLFIIEQQFRAEKSLLSNRINNELLFINLATVRAEGILFPHLLQAVNVVRHFKRHPSFHLCKTETS